MSALLESATAAHPDSARFGDDRIGRKKRTGMPRGPRPIHHRVGRSLSVNRRSTRPVYRTIFKVQEHIADVVGSLATDTTHIGLDKTRGGGRSVFLVTAGLH